MYTVGGLILIKIKRKSKKEPFFKGEINVNYTTTKGVAIEEKYPVFFEFHPEEQFCTAESLRAAIEGYSFTAELRPLLIEAK